MLTGPIHKLPEPALVEPFYDGQRLMEARIQTKQTVAMFHVVI